MLLGDGKSKKKKIHIMIPVLEKPEHHTNQNDKKTSCVHERFPLCICLLISKETVRMGTFGSLCIL
jgi:hypothetical protein